MIDSLEPGAEQMVWKPEFSTDTRDPIALAWLKTSKSELVVFVLNRETGELTSVALPARRPVVSGLAAIRIEGDRARVAWVDSTSAPPMAGQAVLDLAARTWADAVEAALPMPAPDALPSPFAPRKADVPSQGASIADLAFAGDRPALALRGTFGPEPAVGFVSVLDPAAASWSPWARLGLRVELFGWSEGPLVTVEHQSGPAGSLAYSFHGGERKSAPFQLPGAQGQRLSKSLLLFTRSAKDGSSHALLDAGTLTQTDLSGTTVRPWKSGLSVDLWSSLEVSDLPAGRTVAQLATSGDGLLVARVFPSGAQAPALEVPAPADFLSVRRDWSVPVQVRSEREICLFGGALERKNHYPVPYPGGLCFNMETRLFRTINTTLFNGVDAHKCRYNGWPLEGLPRVGCLQLTPQTTEHLIMPPSAYRWGWELVGLR